MPYACPVLYGPLFIAYNVFLSLSIGLASSRQQTIEASIIQYLWPCVVILFSPAILKIKLNALAVPGIIICFAGAIWCISDGALDFSTPKRGIYTNPMPYIFAFLAALMWGMYCNFSRLYGDEGSCNAFFFLASGALLWCLHYFGGYSIQVSTYTPVMEVLLMGLVFASSYSIWERGIRKGNMVTLATFAYFIPLFSFLFASICLQVPLPDSFLQGAATVVIGSLLCWLADSRMPDPPQREMK